MKIANITSSNKNGKVTLSGQLILESGKTHDVYFEVDKMFDGYLSKDAMPFFPLALPVSMSKRENLMIDDISSRVVSKTSQIMGILRSWNTGFSAISIQAENFKKNVANANNVGCFFSGGVDSFYTYLKNREKINHLIFVHGFDISAQNTDFYKIVEKNIVQITEKEKVKLIKVKTNLRETLEQYFDWDMAHEFALASVSLFLSRGLGEVYMSCGQISIGADHHYMTPQLDSLWSTETMKINHYGCSADKIRKLKFLSKFSLAMRTLRVCWVNSHGQYNCCQCEKCFRNMLALYATNSLEKCKTFEKPIDTSKLKKIKVNPYVLRYFIAALKVLKKKNDRSEIRYALEELVENNWNPRALQRLTGRLRAFVAQLDKTYNHHRLYWFLARRALV